MDSKINNHNISIILHTIIIIKINNTINPKFSTKTYSTFRITISKTSYYLKYKYKYNSQYRQSIDHRRPKSAFESNIVVDDTINRT